MNDYQRGQECARREMRDDRWTAETARDYIAQCAAIGQHLVDGRDEFDRGYMDEVKARAGRL